MSSQLSLMNCFVRATFSICLLAIVLIALACNSASSVSVQLIPNSAQTLEPGKSLPISATLSNDLSQRGVRWTLAGQGELAAQTTTSVMYQAPPNIRAEVSVTVTAISNANGSKTASLTIILTPPKRATSKLQSHQPQGVSL
jgi:hypothetical protein